MKWSLGGSLLYMEGTVSQNFDLCPSFYLFKKNRNLFVNF